MAIGERFLSYAELDELSNHVARSLIAQGVAPGHRVGTLARKPATSVTADFGVLKVGGCYVPLDPKSPGPRLGTIVTDSGTAVILADQATSSHAVPMAGSVFQLRFLIVISPQWGPGGAGDDPAGWGDPASPGPAVVPWDAVEPEVGEFPIGKACANTDVFAVTSEGDRVTKSGEEGKLHVRDPALMHGYWGHPERPAECWYGTRSRQHTTSRPSERVNW